MSDERDSGYEGSLTCKEHPGMSLVVYCVQHDEVLCTTCMSVNHSMCTGFQPLSGLLSDSSTIKEAKTLQKDVAALIQQLQKVKSKRQEDRNKLKEETERAIKDIEEFRALINWVLDKMERKGKNFIQKKYQELSAEIVEDIAKCDELLDTLEKLKRKTKEDTRKLSLENCVVLKKSKYDIKVAEKFCEEIKNTKSRTMVKFTVDPKVENFARSLSWYGKDRTYLSFEQPVSFPHSYQIKFDNQFDIRVKGDRHVCSIVDICQMPDGTILAADAANREIKQLDILYQLVDCCCLSGEPVATCWVSDKTVAVALKDNSDTVIQYIEIKNSLKLSSSFSIAGHCFGLASDQSRLFISNGKNLSTFPLTGEPLGEVLCPFSAYHISLSIDAKKLVVVSGEGRLVVITTEGEILREENNTNIKSSSKVTVDQNGQIFVSHLDCDSVVQYNHDLRELGSLVTAIQGIKQPQAITFDRIHNRLVVGTRSKNVIKVFDLI